MAVLTNTDLQQMAAAGFFVVKANEDNCKCYMCHKELDGWEPGDDPMKEHSKHAPACPLMNLHLEENRLLTFKQWPHKKHHAGPADFSKAGFVHAPTTDEPDNVKCISCGKNLSGWEPDDEPMAEHRRGRGATCPFVRSVPTPGGEETANTATITSATAVDGSGIEGAIDARPAPNEPSRKRDAAAIEDTDGADGARVGFAVEIEEGMSVEQYMKAHCDMEVHKLVHNCEARIAEFESRAAVVRTKIVAL